MAVNCNWFAYNYFFFFIKEKTLKTFFFIKDINVIMSATFNSYRFLFLSEAENAKLLSRGTTKQSYKVEVQLSAAPSLRTAALV